MEKKTGTLHKWLVIQNSPVDNKNSLPSQIHENHSPNSQDESLRSISMNVPVLFSKMNQDFKLVSADNTISLLSTSINTLSELQLNKELTQSQSKTSAKKKRFAYLEKNDDCFHKVCLAEPNLDQFKISMPYKPYSYQTESIAKILGAILAGSRTIMYESPTGTGKTQTLLSSLLGLNEFLRKHKGEAGHKILYFTRTVSQMNQVVEEIKKSAFSVTSTIMASRGHLCLNKSVLAHKSNVSLKTACRDAQKQGTCPYKAFLWRPYAPKPVPRVVQEKSENDCFEVSARRPEVFPEKSSQSANLQPKQMLMNSRVNDIEDLKMVGRCCSICPYYYSKYIAQSCDVVVMSYNYLIDPECRPNIEGLIEGSLIVFDEAHNIARVLEEANSWDIEFKAFDKMTEDLSVIRGFLEGKKARNSEIECPAEFAVQANLLVQNIKGSILEITATRGVAELQAGEQIVWIFQLENFARTFVLEAILEVMYETKIKSPLEKFIRIYIQLKKDFKADPSIFSKFKIHFSEEKTLYFVCLDSGIQFRNILGLKPKTIILSSGTLSPFENMERQLGLTFDTKFSILPNIDVWKRKFMVIKMSNLFEFNDHKKVLLNFKSRTEIETIKGFFKLIEELSLVVPQGILIFLPSYGLLEEYKKLLCSDSSLYSRLEKLKKIYFESKLKNFVPQFEAYKNSCKGRGAIFFVVFGGKFSEGMDFKNELARLVIILGLPFSNFNDFRVQAKKAFLDANKKNRKTAKLGDPEPREKVLSFNEWYNYETLLQVNQAIGRVKRNEDDFGLVLLIDSRYSELKYDRLLSRHIRELNCEFEEFKQFKEFISGFYAQNLKRQKIISTSFEGKFNS